MSLSYGQFLPAPASPLPSSPPTSSSLSVSSQLPALSSAPTSSSSLAASVATSAAAALVSSEETDCSGDQFCLTLEQRVGRGLLGPNNWSDCCVAMLLKLHRDAIRNWTGSPDDPRYDYLNIPVVKAVVVVVYVVVIVLGVTGNLVVVYAVSRHRRLRTATNGFIVCLALSDIALCAFSLPIQLHYQLTDRWEFGAVLCRAVFAAFAVPMFLSTLTILLIAVDRYRHVVCPLRRPLSLPYAAALVGLSIATSLLLGLPVVAFTTVHVVRDVDLRLERSYCVEEWPDDVARVVYAALTFVVQFCVPLIVSGVLYWRIYCRLRRRPSRGRVTDCRRHTTTRIIAAIVVLFLVCWSPWNVHSLLAEINRHVVHGPHFKLVDLLLKVFALGSAAINPFLYCWLNANFRQELEAVAVRLHIYRGPPAEIDGPLPGGGAAAAVLGRATPQMLRGKLRAALPGTAPVERYESTTRPSQPRGISTLGVQCTVVNCYTGTDLLTTQRGGGSISLQGGPSGALLQLTTLAVIEHRSVTSSRSSSPSVHCELEVQHQATTAFE